MLLGSCRKQQHSSAACIRGQLQNRDFILIYIRKLRSSLCWRLRTEEGGARSEFLSQLLQQLEFKPLTQAVRF